MFFSHVLYISHHGFKTVMFPAAINFFSMGFFKNIGILPLNFVILSYFGLGPTSVFSIPRSSGSFISHQDCVNAKLLCGNIRGDRTWLVEISKFHREHFGCVWWCNYLFYLGACISESAGCLYFYQIDIAVCLNDGALVDHMCLGQCCPVPTHLLKSTGGHVCA